MNLKSLVCLCFCLISINVYAVRVSDDSIIFDGADRMKQIVIKNDTDEIKTYNFELIDMEQNSDLSYREIKNKKDGAKQFIIFSPKQVSVMPGESQTVRFKRMPILNDESKEYVSHFIIKSNNKSENYLPIIIRRGNLEVEIELDVVEMKNNLLRLKLDNNSEKSVLYNVRVFDDDMNILANDRVWIFAGNDEPDFYIPLNVFPYDKCFVEIVENDNVDNRLVREFYA